MDKQLHAGKWTHRGKTRPVWHSNDNGKTWWSGFLFSSSDGIPTKKLIKMLESVLKDLKETHEA